MRLVFNKNLLCLSHLFISHSFQNVLCHFSCRKFSGEQERKVEWFVAMSRHEWRQKNTRNARYRRMMRTWPIKILRASNARFTCEMCERCTAVHSCDRCTLSLSCVSVMAQGRTISKKILTLTAILSYSFILYRQFSVKTLIYMLSGIINWV